MASRKASIEAESPPQPTPEESGTPESGPPESALTSGNRFFSWMRGLGIPRQPGWLGGVSAGVGLRLGVDPIIVRGVIVVVAVLGGPALLLYAAAWLLLPDTEDRIHAEDLGRGRFDPAMVGIGVLILLSFLPLTQGFWWAGAAFWGDLSVGASVGRAVWIAVLLSAIVLLIIVLARKSESTNSTKQPRAEESTSEHATSAADAPTSAGASPIAETSSASGAASAAGTDTAPIPPPSPSSDATEDELQAWKEGQAQWKEQHAEWKRQQSATEQELRQQRALEAHERGLAAAAERAERRRLRQLANPRLSAATTWAVLGAAILAGGIAALAFSGNPGVGGHEVTVALAVGTIALGLAIVVAGAFRHRSGALGFFAVVAIVALLVSAFIPRDRIVAGPDAYWSVAGDLRLASPAGRVHLDVYNIDADRARDGWQGTTDVWQGPGDTKIHIEEGASVRLVLESESGNITTYDDAGHAYGLGENVAGLRQMGDVWQWTTVLGPDPAPQRTIRLEQQGGRLVIYDNNIPTPTREPAPSVESAPSDESAPTEEPAPEPVDEGVQR